MSYCNGAEVALVIRKLLEYIAPRVPKPLIVCMTAYMNEPFGK